MSGIKTVTIFGIEFTYRFVSNNFSTGKNITINNENFGLIGNFLKLFETEINKLKNSSLLTKNSFRIDFSLLINDAEVILIDNNLSVKRISENKFVLNFNGFKNLNDAIIQFNSVADAPNDLKKLNFNYNLTFNETLLIYDKMYIDFDANSAPIVDLIIL